MEFRKGKIQDLGLDIEQLEQWLEKHPVRDFRALERISGELRRAKPLVSDDSVDVVVSNCVLNLIRTEDND